MMRRSRVFALVGALLACDDGEGGAVDAATSALPPPAPDGGTPPAATTMTFVINQIFLGDADRDGVQSNNAWKRFGFNIDGKFTTKTSRDGCTLDPGVGDSVQVDGENGIDNS